MQKMAVVLRWLSGRDSMNIVTSYSLHFDNHKHSRPLLVLLLLLVFCPFCTFSLLSVLLPSSPGNKPCLPPSASSPLLPVTPPFSSAYCNLPTLLLVHYTDLTMKRCLAAPPTAGAKVRAMWSSQRRPGNNEYDPLFLDA